MDQDLWRLPLCQASKAREESAQEGGISRCSRPTQSMDVGRE